MYEQKTYETILDTMLATARENNPAVDTREGSVVWYGQAPAAVEMQNLYIELDTILRETFGDTASRYYLIKRARERGLEPYPASAAVYKAVVTPAELELPIGTRFSVDNENFIAVKKLNDGEYKLECETAGEQGNAYTGRLIPIEYIHGLQSAQLGELLIPGEDEEGTESFRARYLASFNAQAFGGNVADYKEKVNAIAGVGGVKVYRAWNGNIRPADFVPPDSLSSWLATADLPPEIRGWVTATSAAADKKLLTVGGTVRLVIIDAQHRTPSELLVDTVQTAIDPVRNHGEGLGLAPVGHVVLVEGVRSVPINIAMTLTYRDGWTWEDARPYLENVIDEHFEGLATGWEAAEASLVVRISQLESRILNCPGILDVSETRLNGNAQNFMLGADDIPVRGELVG